MKETNKNFNAALSDFVHDVASGGAIRHLADLGYTVTEIKDRLSFPTPRERVAHTVWKHFLDTGKIVSEIPREDGILEKVSYIQEYGEYGKPTMRKVVERVEIPKRTYLLCRFGIEKYKDPEAFEKSLEALTERDRQYIMDLPWPVGQVYHEADERMKRIMEKLEKGKQP